MSRPCTGLLGGRYQDTRYFGIKVILLIVISLLPGPLWGEGIGTKPSYQVTQPPTYERTQPKQYEKPVGLRLSPNTEDVTTTCRVKKDDHGLTSKFLTNKSKKKAKLPDKKEETSSDMGLGRQPEPSSFSTKGTDRMK